MTHRILTGGALAVLSLSLVAQADDEIQPQPSPPPAEVLPIVNEGGIRDHWMLAGAPLALPAYPEGFGKEARDVCIALGYQVNADGTTSNFRVLHQWNSQTGGIEPVDGFWAGFALAGTDAVSQWKFAPRPEAGPPQPVFTVATLTWNTTHGMWPADLRERCRIRNLAVFVRALPNPPGSGLNDHLHDRRSRAQDHYYQRIAGTP